MSADVTFTAHEAGKNLRTRFDDLPGKDTCGTGDLIRHGGQVNSQENSTHV